MHRAQDHSWAGGPGIGLGVVTVVCMCCGTLGPRSVCEGVHSCSDYESCESCNGMNLRDPTQSHILLAPLQPPLMLFLPSSTPRVFDKLLSAQGQSVLCGEPACKVHHKEQGGSRDQPAL